MGAPYSQRVRARTRGYPGGAMADDVAIAAVIVDGELDITVRDHGRGRERTTEGRGRGLMLMRELMDRVEVTPSDDGATVRMWRRLSALAGGLAS
ncbi:MAG: ATP-binding protein [Thermoleophilaceae bacterium]